MSKIQTLHKAMQVINAAHKEAKGEVYEIINGLIQENDTLEETVSKLQDKIKELEENAKPSLTLTVPKDREKSASLTMEVDYEKQEVKKVEEEERMSLADALISTDLIRDFSPTPEKIKLQQDTMARLAEVLGITIKENATMIDRYPVLLVAKDNTGSMGVWETYMAQCVAHWTKAMLHLHYGRGVDARYITFDKNGGKRATFEKCFTKGSDSGTLVSPAVTMLNSLTDNFAYEDYHDVYVLILSDGDNLNEDSAPMVRQINRLAPKTEQLWYVEMNQYNRLSHVMNAFKPNPGTNTMPDNMTAHIIQTKGKVYAELNEMFKSVVAQEEK